MHKGKGAARLKYTKAEVHECKSAKGPKSKRQEGGSAKMAEALEGRNAEGQKCTRAKGQGARANGTRTTVQRCKRAHGQRGKGA